MSTDIFDDLRAELSRARAKFPKNDHLFAALGEEVGELARELLEAGGRRRVREEAIQVACVALRIAEEGDGDFPLSDLILPEPQPESIRYSSGELPRIGDSVLFQHGCDFFHVVKQITSYGSVTLVCPKGPSRAFISDLVLTARAEASQ